MVTDSTATLPPAMARAAGVRVVSLDLTIGGWRTLDADFDGAELLAALERGERPVTSQPPPAAFAAAYERAAAEGAAAVVSVHLSGALSGTVTAARVAAAGAAVPVVVVDSGTVGMALGFAVLAAARAGTPQAPAPPVRWWRRWASSARGLLGPVPREDATAPTPPDVNEVAATAQAVAASSQVWLLVDSLDYLRRGGRLSGTSALLGTILQLRPLLTVADGRLAVVGKVRTRRAARARLVQLAVESVATRTQARLAVHHLDNRDAAAELARQVVAATGGRVVETVVTQAGAVLAAHVGPGMLAVAVTDAQCPGAQCRDDQCPDDHVTMAQPTTPPAPATPSPAPRTSPKAATKGPRTTPVPRPAPTPDPQATRPAAPTTAPGSREPSPAHGDDNQRYQPRR